MRGLRSAKCASRPRLSFLDQILEKCGKIDYESSHMDCKHVICDFQHEYFSKPIYTKTAPKMICLDTNVWLKERMLSSQAGKALIDYIRSCNAKIFRPAIVIAELNRNLSKRIAEIDTEIRSLEHERKQLLGNAWDSYTALTGSPDDIVRMAQYEFKEFLIDASDSDQAKLSAADRVIKGKLPNLPKNQQFKDSLLWEELLLLKERSAVLITSDKNFYELQDHKRGMAGALRDELIDQVTIDLFPDISSFLEQNGRSVLKTSGKGYARIAHNLLFLLGDIAIRELESKHAVRILQMSPAESSYRLLKSENTLSMQLLGWCAPFVEQPGGGSIQLRLDVYGEAIISNMNMIPGSVILKEWRLYQGGYIEGGLSSELDQGA